RGGDRPHAKSAERRSLGRCAGICKAAAAKGRAGRRGLDQKGSKAPGGRPGTRRYRSRAAGIPCRPGGQTGSRAMIRLILFFLAILAIAAGLHWLADRPGTIVIEWQQYVAETSVFGAIVILLLSMGAVMAVSFLLRWLWSSPAAVGQLLHRRRARRGLDALASGMIAVGAGGRTLAVRYARPARKALPHQPLT